jgi:hypothetical protein
LTTAGDAETEQRGYLLTGALRQMIAEVCGDKSDGTNEPRKDAAVDSGSSNDRGRNDQAAYPRRKATIQSRFLGSLLRFVFAKSWSCFSDIDFSICFEAPLRLDFGRFPRFAANAAPAAICCFFEVAGIPIIRGAVQIRPGEKWLRSKNQGWGPKQEKGRA